MRILLVSKLAPNAPASGSVLRLAHTANGLAQVGEVDCAQWNPVPWGTPAGTTEVRWDGPSPTGRLVRISAHGVPNRLHRVFGLAWAAAARALGAERMLPLEISRSGRPRRRAKRELVRRARASDLVWFFKIDAAVAMPVLLDLPVPAIVDVDDFVHLPPDSPDDAAPSPSWVDALDQRSWTHRYRDIARRADALAVANPDEASRLGDGRVIVVPNGTTVPARVDRRRAASARPVLTFVGLMKYAPNTDAAEWLAHAITPALRERVDTDFEVRIVGDPPPAVRALGQQPNVTVTGFVDELDAELALADVALVPLRQGTGTRLKILEAFAHGIPVVSTTIGAAGLDVVHDEHLLLADTPDTFAEACVRVLRDNALRARLTTSARQLVQTRYDWRNIEATIADVARATIETTARDVRSTL
jgi:glycosyltransferase involved in cell wall biosynthesis